MGTIAPEQRRKRGIRAEQQARRVNKLDNPALSAKPPPPVQIRAAPPKFPEDLTTFAPARHNVPASGTNTGWDGAKTKIRNDINQWIRTKAGVDAGLDFDKVVRDPGNPDLISPAFNCGDGIHPSPIGY